MVLETIFNVYPYHTDEVYKFRLNSLSNRVVVYVPKRVKFKWNIE